MDGDPYELICLAIEKFSLLAPDDVVDLDGVMPGFNLKGERFATVDEVIAALSVARDMVSPH